ncbi:MAG: DUF2791 family P-loop domain-containing protein [Actinobacteria bacterium]|nr:DUF2791 family P-loop domain-containing protein [Actinomycetota bacterium]
MQVRKGEWLGLLRREYLENYVSEGGAAVKFAVVDPPDGGGALLDAVTRDAAALGYLTAHVDAAHAKVHMMQDVFHAIARATPWDDLTDAWVRSAYEASGFDVGEELELTVVAERNRLDPAIVGNELKRKLQDLLGGDQPLAKDFRWAMFGLGVAAVGPKSAEPSPDAQALLDWLTGDLRLVTSVKRHLIYRRIGRHNARAMLTSLSRWTRATGRPGLVVTVDIRPLLVPKRADVPEGEVYYTPAAVMDAYEVLRQLVDATEEMEGALFVVLAEEGLFDDSRRSVKGYKALFERVWADVSVRERPNPLSALTRVTGAVR